MRSARALVLIGRIAEGCSPSPCAARRDFVVELRGFEPMAIVGAARSRAIPPFAGQCAQPARGPHLLDRDRRPRLLNAVADGESAEEAQSVAVVLAAASAASERENLEARISALENARQNPNE